jgi:hypothetical protein
MPSPPSEQPGPNPFWPFNNRHDFDWVIHYVQDLAASRRQINQGLDLWLSSTLHPDYAGPPVPWKNAKEMYQAVDAIQQGTIPWKTYEIKYNGPVDANSPKWKLQTYTLCYRDVVLLMEEQLANPAFKDECNYAPFMELDEMGQPIYSEFFSGEWSWMQCVSFIFTEKNFAVLIYNHRMKLPRIRLPMVLFLSLSSVAAIKPPSLLRPATKSFTQYMSERQIFRMLHVVPMAQASCLLRFFLSQKVCCILFIS